MSEELVQFLTTRLAEDEAVIRRNLGHDGLGDGGHFPDYQTYWDSDTDAATDYLTHFAPPRQLREVEAKRAIIAMCSPDTLTPEYYDAWQDALHHLASVYRNHPDWRKDWTA